MMNATDVFDRHAGAYNATRRRLIPPYDAFYGTAVEAIALAGAPPERILDLGAGTGLLAGAVRNAYPRAQLTLSDGAAAMLEQARAALGEADNAYVRADLTAALPAGPWDAVVSALAIHHLDDADKRRLFARVRDALRDGGVFVNAEQVAGPTDRFTRLYREWHERRAREAGATQEEWEAAVQRMSYDRCAGAEDQLAWLREAGFADADCLFKDHCFAVLVARR